MTNDNERSRIEREIAAYLAGIDRAVEAGAFRKAPTIEQRTKGAWGHLSLICDDVDIDDVAAVVSNIEGMKAQGVEVAYSFDPPVVPVGPMSDPIVVTSSGDAGPTSLNVRGLALMLATRAPDGSYNGQSS